MFKVYNPGTKNFHTEFYFMFPYIHFTPRGSPLNGTFLNMLPAEMQVTLLQYSLVYFTSVCPVLYLFPSMHALHLCWEWPFNSDLYMEICMGNNHIPQVSLQSFLSVTEQSLCNFRVAGFSYYSSYNVRSEFLLLQDQRNKKKVSFTISRIFFREWYV
jgi:hypothetical protein